MKTVKKIAWLLCFVLIVSTVIGNNHLKAEAQGDGTTFTVNVTDTSGVEGNSVSYKLGSAIEWASVSSGDAIDIKDASNITIKATANEGARVEASSGEGFADGTDFGGITGEVGGTFNLNDGVSYTLNVKFVNNNGGEQNESSQSNAGLKLNISNRDSATGQVTYTFLDTNDASLGTSTVSESTTSNIAFPEGTTKVNIKVIPGENSQLSYYGVNLDGQPVSETSKDAAIGTEGNTITVSSTSKEYEVQVEFAAVSGGSGGNPVPTDVISFRVEGDKADEAIKSGAVQYSTDNGQNWEIVDSALFALGADVTSAQIKVTDSEGKYDLTSINITEDGGFITSGKAYIVAEKKEYQIQIDKKVCTVIWAYDNSQGDDAFVEHGKVEIVKAVAAGETGDWSGIEPTDLPGANNNQQDDKGGRVAIIPGSTVTVRIVPDYKYQFTAGKLNDTVLTPDEENVSTFTFTMPATNLHLSALFAYSDDIMDYSGAAGVAGAAIEGGDKVISSGNLELTVKDFTDENKKNSLQSSTAASGLQVSQWLEVDLKQVVNQGASDKYWKISKDELPTKIKVILTVGTDLDANKEYVVVREHDGVYERIPAIYDKTAGTLTFESDKFSDYAVGTVVSASDVLGTINSNWSNGDESSAVSTVNALISTYGTTGIAGAVQTFDGTVNNELLVKLTELETDYAAEKHITVNNPAIASAVSGSLSGTVKVTGAAFNVDDNSSVQLVIADKTGSGITVGNSYSKSVQLDISLVKTASGLSNTTAVTELSMPVTITMPVPTGIDASRLVILHDKDGNGTSDETVPYSLAGSYITFTVTHFSNFAFAEEVVSEGGGNAGGETVGNESNSGSSSDNDSSVEDSVKEEKVTVPVEYIVVKGDTLGRIARKNNLTLSALLALNPQIKNPNLIYPGQKIVVGYITKTVTAQNTVTPNTSASYYTVQKGDFLYRIARKNGLTINQLAVLNPEIMKQKYIYPGQKIRVK